MASGTVLRAAGSTLLGTCKTYSSFFPLYIYVCFTSIHAPSVQLSKRRKQNVPPTIGLINSASYNSSKVLLFVLILWQAAQNNQSTLHFFVKNRRDVTVNTEETVSNNVHMSQICQQDEFTSIQFKSAQFSSVYTEYCRNEITTKVASKYLCCKESTIIQSDKVEQQ